MLDQAGTVMPRRRGTRRFCGLFAGLLFARVIAAADNELIARQARDVGTVFGNPGQDATTVQAALPAQVDLRPEFKRLKLSQRRQGERGTCSVFATVEAIEFAIGRATGHAPRLSVEFANWAANAATKRNDDGDFFHNIMRGVERFGICEEPFMPYARAFMPSNTPSAEATAQANRFKDEIRLSFQWIKDWTRKPGLNDGDLRQIKVVLAKGFPVSAGSYHSVLFVGYEDNAELPGGGRFFVADSNLVERDITYEAAKKRMCDLFWVRAERKTQSAAKAL
jgi:C1A family cysteine protease